MFFIFLVFFAWLANSFYLLKLANNTCDRLLETDDMWYLQTRDATTQVYDYYTPWYIKNWLGLRPHIKGGFKSPTEK